MKATGFPFPIPIATLWDGSTFNDDGFPADSNGNISVCGPKTNWPVSMSYSDAQKLYWRVKEYQLTCHMTDLVDHTQDFDYTPANAAMQTRHAEQGLIVPSNPPLYTCSLAMASLTDPVNGFDQVNVLLFSTYVLGASIGFESELTIEGNNVDFPLLQCDGLFYPAFAASITSAPITVDRTFLRQTDLAIPGTADADVSFDSDTQKFTVDFLADGPGGVGFTSQTYKAILTATSWWPYGGRYNASTGLYVP